MRARARASALAALFGVLVAGCATQPLPAPPAPPQEDRFVAAPPGSTDEAVLSADGKAGGVALQRILPGAALHGDWWQVFHAGRLDALVARALAGNRSLQEASANLAQAEDYVQVTRAAGGVQADLTGGAGREKYGAQFLGTLPKPPPFSYFSVGPTVSYAVDLAGGESHDVARQQALALLARHRLTAARLALSGNVVEQALAAALADQQLATAGQLVERDQAWLQLARAGVQEGALARSALPAIQAQLAADQERLPPAREAAARARHALSLLMGQTPVQELPPLPPVEDWQLPTGMPVGVPSELAHRRPDILAAEAGLRASTEAVGIATADLYPQLTLTATTGLQATDPGHFFSPASGVFGLAAGLTAPLFDGGRRHAVQRAAEDAVRADAAHYEHTVLAAFGQVADALAALVRDHDALVASSQGLASASAAASDARQAVDTGSGNRLHQLAAECAELRSRLDWQQDLARRLRDTAVLLLALGGSGEETFQP